ncbi:MAG TPA: electron transfer flavoprotein subunit alpha/FixB family protein [Gammaproteobacteria bacterium]|nr:electron transfer flavoprotein subunit alpha/FixB family protein [Gammaproteobacteria bacterium]
MKILLLLEHDDTHLLSANFHALSAARQLGDTIDALLIGHLCDAVLSDAKKSLAVDRIRVADAPEYAHELPENVAPLIAHIAKEYDVILTAGTTYGKNSLPRVAALLDVNMLSDVTEIISPDVFVRPIYAGNALMTVKSSDHIKVLTIRKTAFSGSKREENPKLIIEPLTDIIPNTQSEFVSETLTHSGRPELTDARIVVSGGRAFKSADNFKQLERFADSIGAAVGASRAAVDAGFAPNDYQVGQTGKVVAPDLYIAIGISGAIQHLAGMKDSKVIVAINNDPEAPVFEVADYGLVGDLFKILPELQDELSKEMKCD